MQPKAQPRAKKRDARQRTSGANPKSRIRRISVEGITNQTERHTKIIGNAIISSSNPFPNPLVICSPRGVPSLPGRARPVNPQKMSEERKGSEEQSFGTRHVHARSHERTLIGSTRASSPGGHKDPAAAWPHGRGRRAVDVRLRPRQAGPVIAQTGGSNADRGDLRGAEAR